jgi:hypothetical protein
LGYFFSHLAWLIKELEHKYILILYSLVIMPTEVCSYRASLDGYLHKHN